MKFYILNKLTIVMITAIVIVQLFLTNGESAKTSWLFIAYGVFYIVRIVAMMINDGTLRKFFDE